MPSPQRPPGHDRALQRRRARRRARGLRRRRSASTRRRRCSTPASRSGSSACPVGSRIVYPPPPLPGLADVDGGDRRGARRPARAWTRSTRCCGPGMRLTIAFDDISLPLPPMRTPDIRERVIEQVLERAYRAGRRRHPPDRRARAAPPDDAGRAPPRRRRARLRRASTPTASTTTTPRTRTASSSSARPPRRGGRAQQARRRVRPARLREHQPGARWTAATSRSPIGLGTYRSLRAPPQRAHDAPLAVVHGPAEVELHHSARRQGEIVEAAVPIFHIETTLNNDMFAGPLSLPGQARGALDARATRRRSPPLKRTTDRMPPKLRRAAVPAQRRALRGRPACTAGAVDAGARGHARALRRPAGGRGARARPTSSPPGCRTSARTTSTRS